jgi:hypothetical protein
VTADAAGCRSKSGDNRQAGNLAAPPLSGLASSASVAAAGAQAILLLRQWLFENDHFSRPEALKALTN